jgi:hypothetical protein
MVLTSDSVFQRNISLNNLELKRFSKNLVLKTQRRLQALSHIGAYIETDLEVMSKLVSHGSAKNVVRVC